MPREQLVKKEADIIPIHKEKEDLREEYFKYSLGEGKEKREELGKLNQEIRGLEEELEILDSALKAQNQDAQEGKKKKTKLFTVDEIVSITEAINDVRLKLRELSRKHFMLESSVAGPDVNELDALRRELREEKKRKN